MMVTWKCTRWVVSLEVCADECVFDVFISAEGHKRRCFKYILGMRVFLYYSKVVVDNPFDPVVEWMVGEGERNATVCLASVIFF